MSVRRDITPSARSRNRRPAFWGGRCTWCPACLSRSVRPVDTSLRCFVCGQRGDSELRTIEHVLRCNSRCPAPETTPLSVYSIYMESVQTCLDLAQVLCYPVVFGSHVPQAFRWVQWWRTAQGSRSRPTQAVIAERIQCLSCPRQPPCATAGGGRTWRGARRVGGPSVTAALPG